MFLSPQRRDVDQSPVAIVKRGPRFNDRKDWANFVPKAPFVPKWAKIVPKVRTLFQKGGKRTLLQKETNFVPKEGIL